MRALRRVPGVAAVAVLVAGPVTGLAADAVSIAYTRPGTAVTTTAVHAGLRERPAAPAMSRPPALPAPESPPSSGRAGTAAGFGSAPRQLTVPDLAVVVPAGITAGQVTAIRALPGVRAVLAVDGGQITVNGRRASVLGVPLPAFRSWTPPVTAAASGVWTVLAAGSLVAASSSAAALGVSLGDTYPVAGIVRMTIPVMATAPLGVPGIDAIVSDQRATQLGLARDAMVLVNAPNTGYAALVSRIRRITGPRAMVINLVPVVQPGRLPVITAVNSDRPENYLELYQDSAADYCRGLSWTVLAAIGEIESGDGAHDGPSSAGALGPMQFMPGTWAEWGTDGFGQTGAPDIMNPFDAVPSAARMLCADGARDGPAGMSQAIYDYNHASWYVSEVMDLAAEYAQEYLPPAKG